MKAIVHARLDARTGGILARLRRRTGWSESEIVRRGIRALEVPALDGYRKAVVGLGKFASGVPDLGSGKGHLEGFGRR